MGWFLFLWLFAAWMVFFVLGLLPGALIGWLIGKIPIEKRWSVLLIVTVSIALSLAAAKILSGTGYDLEHHINLLPVFFPPIVLQLLIGRSIALNWKTYLDPAKRA
ncbi:hypothetical protein AB7813_27145 [Tardiphaga sp. 20_F10_N6_6]|uniref:hypothetical protein n=1 Tax=Tardiphaga sp. 20_F10_N6_6 TaxID=3240788 RepID=UPI003F8CD642